MSGLAPTTLPITERASELLERLRAFMGEHVYPREAELVAALDREVAPGVAYPAAFVELRGRARAAGLFNLFLHDVAHGGAGLTHSEYAPLCEEMGRSPVAPAIFNCAPPDTGNTEILLQHGTDAQIERWARPLLTEDVRSCFAMTEPDVAGSDPTLIQTRAVRDGDDYVLDGHKWFTTGATGAGLVIVMCVTDPDAAPHRRASILLMPIDTDGFELVRSVPVMGHAAGPGHAEVRFHGCRVPADALLGGEGEGFAVAQHRLGPGRIHHALRSIGAAERAIELMCRRASARVAFGEPLADKQFVQDFVATSRIEVDQARLLVRAATAQMDAEGSPAARIAISMAKVAAANVHQQVLDRAIQVHGALGVTDDAPLAAMWREGRGLRILDGADEVHKRSIARNELRRWSDDAPAAATTGGKR